jgi:hypothetical protein
MEENSKKTKLISESIWKVDSFSYASEESEYKKIVEEINNNKIISPENKNHIPNLNIEERIVLSKSLSGYKRQIINSWLYSSEMVDFYTKLYISNDELNYYIEYFWWEKILTYIISKLWWLELITEWDKFIFITTSFLSFIKKRNLW